MRKGEHKASAGQKVLFKECVKASRTKKANSCASKIEAAIAKVIKKVTPKNKVLKKVIPKDETLENKSRSGESKGGCILAQSLTPKDENTKRPIKLTLGGLVLNPKGGR